MEQIQCGFRQEIIKGIGYLKIFKRTKEYVCTIPFLNNKKLKVRNCTENCPFLLLFKKLDELEEKCGGKKK